MSAYIVAYQGLDKYEGRIGKVCGGRDEATRIFEVDGNLDFPEFLEGLEIDDVYSYKSEIWFGFGEDRLINENFEKLAGLVQYDWQMPDANDPGPFHELFRWGCVGTIGPAASAKLAADFAVWDARAQARDDESFYGFFSKLRAVFDCVMTDGCLQYRAVPRCSIAYLQ